MCGISGMYRGGGRPVDPSLLLAMAGELRHRGPDGVGLYVDGAFGMANTRLAVVDLESGDQPLSDEAGRYWAMQNGEIYNHVELRSELEQIGHVFETSSDTEVIAHAYEEWGVRCLDRFNGDFALAVWDRRREELFLARDRFGVRPLFLAQYGADVCFASEARAILRHPRSQRELDPVGIADTFTAWATLPDRSAFVGIRELRPAHYALIESSGRISETRWWDVDFAPHDGNDADLLEELEFLLDDAVRLRLRADVQVATYLSGGLDSSSLAALAARRVGAGGLAAFGVGFADSHFDESEAQDAIASHLGLAFQRVTVDSGDIGALFPRMVELAEKPILRTAPVPLLRLSELVRDSGVKVVLTGEGADELFAGYDIFREDAVRRFWAREPDSKLRPLLLNRLNRFLPTDPGTTGAFLSRFYARGLTDVSDPLYSHRIRFENTMRCLRLLDRSFFEGVGADDTATRLVRLLPSSYADFTPLARAQYLEITTFFQGYLLHAQGDRMLMGNSVEGRFPFVDVRIAEFAARLPDRLRLRGLQEKYLLRRASTDLLPREIRDRPKVPYRPPIRSAFSHPDSGLLEFLDGDRVRAAGLLDPTAVSRLVEKLRRDGPSNETDEMAVAGAVSMMILHERFVAHPSEAAPAKATRVVVGASVVPSLVGEAV